MLDLLASSWVIPAGGAVAAKAEAPMHFWPGRKGRQIKDRAHGRERTAMDRRGTETLEGQEMLAHRVALVPGKTVAWIPLVQSLHDGVARGLGKDGCRGNGEALAVPLHDRLLGYGHVPEAACVDEQMLSRQREPLNRPPHGKHTSPVDIDGVDLVDFGEPNRIGQRRLLDLACQAIACGGVEPRGIIHPWN